jgi:hypothetical protein
MFLGLRHYSRAIASCRCERQERSEVLLLLDQKSKVPRPVNFFLKLKFWGLTRNVVDNKGPDFRSWDLPGMLMKTSKLTILTRNVVDK